MTKSGDDRPSLLTVVPMPPFPPALQGHAVRGPRPRHAQHHHQRAELRRARPLLHLCQVRRINRGRTFFLSPKLCQAHAALCSRSGRQGAERWLSRDNTCLPTCLPATNAVAVYGRKKRVSKMRPSRRRRRHKRPYVPLDEPDRRPAVSQSVSQSGHPTHLFACCSLPLLAQNMLSWP